MTRTFALLTPLVAAVLTGLACSGGGSTASQRSSPPNILFVLVDDLRWDDIRVAGHPFVETPNIDRVLARACGS